MVKARRELTYSQLVVTTVCLDGVLHRFLPRVLFLSLFETALNKAVKHVGGIVVDTHRSLRAGTHHTSSRSAIHSRRCPSPELSYDTAVKIFNLCFILSFNLEYFAEASVDVVLVLFYFRKGVLGARCRVHFSYNRRTLRLMLELVHSDTNRNHDVNWTHVRDE